MRRVRSYHEVEAPGGADVLAQVGAQRGRLEERLSSVRNVVLVASGKGGVGKSALTANLAVLLAERGHRVGAADADLSGPSLARMLGAGEASVRVEPDGVVPATGLEGVRLVSMDLLLAPGAPLRWRGPGAGTAFWEGALETSAVRELLADVAWGVVDYLLVDVPPGTDRIARLLDLIPRVVTVLLVTTPSAAAMRVVERSASLLSEARVRAGLVVNMGAVHCPDCGHALPLFGGDGAGEPAPTRGPQCWARIPFDPALAAATDSGYAYTRQHPASPAAAALRALADRLEEECP